MIKDELTLVQKIVLNEYSKDNNGSIKKYPSLELVRLEKMFFGNSNSGSKLLEYGIGGGPNTEHLLKEGYEVYGLDIADIALNTTKERIQKIGGLKEKLHLKKLELSATSLDFENDSFDYVVAMSVLSLLGNELRIYKLLEEFKRVTKKGGKIILDINDQNSEFSAGKEQIEKNVFLAGPYKDNIKCYCLEKEEDFKKLLEKFFIVKDIGYSGHKVFGRRINEWIACAINP